MTNFRAEDDNDINIDMQFFRTRGKVKNPRKQTEKHSVTNVVLPMPRKNGPRGNIYKNTKSGVRADILDAIPRSGWEANFMRILMLYGIDAQFEPVEFRFPIDAKGRTSAYLPDFYLTDTDEFVEVKGYLDARGRSKLRKFKKHYPDEFSRLTVVISKSNKPNKLFFKKLGVKSVLYYEHLALLYKVKLINWEGR